MKKIINTTLLLVLITIGFSACKKEDNSPSNTSTGINPSIQQGTWRVTSYIDSGNDETNHYTGYSFQFTSGGTVNATNSAGTTSGVWSSGNDDSQVKLILNFSTTPFNELNDDWHVTQQSSTIIKLEDVSGGNGGIDYLIFEKI